MKFGDKVTKRIGSAGLKAALIFHRLLGLGIRAGFGHNYKIWHIKYSELLKPIVRSV